MDNSKISVNVNNFHFQIEIIDSQNARIEEYFPAEAPHIPAGSAELRNNILDVTLYEPFLSEADTNNLYYWFLRATRTHFSRMRAGTVLREHVDRREAIVQAGYRAELDRARAMREASREETEFDESANEVVMDDNAASDADSSENDEAAPEPESTASDFILR